MDTSRSWYRLEGGGRVRDGGGEVEMLHSRNRSGSIGLHNLWGLCLQAGGAPYNTAVERRAQR